MYAIALMEGLLFDLKDCRPPATPYLLDRDIDAGILRLATAFECLHARSIPHRSSALLPLDILQFHDTLPTHDLALDPRAHFARRDMRGHTAKLSKASPDLWQREDAF